MFAEPEEERAQEEEEGEEGEERAQEEGEEEEGAVWVADVTGNASPQVNDPKMVLWCRQGHKR